LVPMPTRLAGARTNKHKQREPLSASHPSLSSYHHDHPQRCGQLRNAKASELNIGRNATNVLKLSQVLQGSSLTKHSRRDKFTIHSKAVVCQDVEMKGDITIGAGIMELAKQDQNTETVCRDHYPSESDHLRYSWADRYWLGMHHRRSYHHC
jgi:hypothetical protein